jgi:hypothetical protein
MADAPRAQKPREFSGLGSQDADATRRSDGGVGPRVWKKVANAQGAELSAPGRQRLNSALRISGRTATNRYQSLSVTFT